MAIARRAAFAPTRPLITPEGVDLRVRLADAGTRASAFLLDAPTKGYGGADLRVRGFATTSVGGCAHVGCRPYARRLL